MSNDSDSSTTTTDDQKVVKIIELVSEAKELARTLTPTEGQIPDRVLDAAGCIAELTMRLAMLYMPADRRTRARRLGYGLATIDLNDALTIAWESACVSGEPLREVLARVLSDDHWSTFDRHPSITEEQERAMCMEVLELSAAGALESKPYPGDTDSDSEVSP